MSFLMTAAPMAMVGCGHSVGEAALGIQWHVLAMFAPSFFTGRLIARFGKRTITGLGLALIAASGALALMGLALTHFWGALVLLGLGWNFGFIGATAMLADCHRPSERAKVQALNDFLVFGTVAVASFGSGQLLHTVGWDGINTGMLPLVGGVLALLLWQGWRVAAARANA
jgi:MFS family permease